MNQRRNLEQRDRLAAWVRAYLKQHGPSSFEDIQRDLNATKDHLGKVSSMLQRQGVLYVKPRRSPNDPTYWSLTPLLPCHVKAPAIRPLANPYYGVDQADLDWMAYWRLPRAERRALAMREGCRP